MKNWRTRRWSVLDLETLSVDPSQVCLLGFQGQFFYIVALLRHSTGREQTSFRTCLERRFGRYGFISRMLTGVDENDFVWIGCNN
jgi:hypothetical protein